MKPEGFTFQWEKAAGFIREAMPLFRRHHAALINIKDAPFEPDFDRYFTLEQLGMLHILTVRHEGQLAGYAIWVSHPHPWHAGLKSATAEPFWVDEPFRQGATGIKLFTLSEEGLRKIGVSLLYAYAQLDFETQRGGVGQILGRLGFKPMDQIYFKDLR